MALLKPNEKRAKIAIILILVVLGINFLHIVSYIMQYLLLKRSLTEGLDMVEATANDQREQILAIIYLIVLIFSAVTFIRWFRRAYNNLHQKVSYLAESEGWAAGGWFVPIVNLYKPYHIMKEMFLETNKLLKNSTQKTKNLDLRIVNIWWTLWIIYTIFDRIYFYLSENSETIEDYLSLTYIGILSEFLSIISGIMAILVVKNYAELEPLLNNLQDEIDTIGTSEDV